MLIGNSKFSRRDAQVVAEGSSMSSSDGFEHLRILSGDPLRDALRDSFNIRGL